MKTTDLLIGEHKVILRALDVLDVMTARIEQAHPVEESDIGAILDFLRWFGDAHHQAKEETVLFPALKHSGSQNRPVEHMTFEHDQERDLIEAMEKDLRLARHSEFVACANRLSSTLRNHIYKEDHILFEAADALLSPQDDDVVYEQLSHFETAVDKQVLEEKLERLRALEWTYLRR